MSRSRTPKALFELTTKTTKTNFEPNHAKLFHSKSLLSTTTTLSKSPLLFSAQQRQLKKFYSVAAPAATPSFPCVDQNEARTQRLQAEYGNNGNNNNNNVNNNNSNASGPEPAYSKVVTGYQVFHYQEPFSLDYGGVLPSFDIAYETWGELNADCSNAILLHTGLSASSHARSQPLNTAKGWWEEFIGPGKPLDTNQYFVICTNVLGGCYGSTGPSSPHPSDGRPYATRFPIISVFDMVRAQFKLLDHLGISRLFASVGSSMGGMQSIAAAHLEPERVGKVVSISGTSRTGPASIALRYAQRSVLMSDPNWNRGFYYDGIPPHTGMKLARQIATITYRSGPEWEQRFGRRRRPVNPPNTFTQPDKACEIDSSSEGTSHLSKPPPALCPDFLIETYLDHQGEQFCLKYDANSLIYISKAMDLFDMTESGLEELKSKGVSSVEEQGSTFPPNTKPHISTLATPSHLSDLANGLRNISRHPVLIIGVQSDLLFPVNEQRELAEALRMLGNDKLSYYELNSPYGHDSFLVDVGNVGGALRGFLSL